jgi:hypothetical protein
VAFKQKKLNVSFALGSGTFGDTGKNQSKLEGLRMIADIRRAGGVAMSTAMLEIYGMTLDMMNQLSTLGLVATTVRRNTVQVEAGDADGMTVVFTGTIINAYPDFSSLPDVAFRVEAHTMLIDAVAPSPPQSFPQPTKASDILAGIAGQLGVPFENNGVTTILPPSYFSGALRQQALAVVKAAGCLWNGVEDGTLAIWNPGESRGGQAPLVSKDTGMILYPQFSSNGITLRTTYNPSIGFGKKIVVESALGDVLAKSLNQTAKGRGVSKDKKQTTWVVFDLNHRLAAQMPRGPWFSFLQAAPLGLGPQVP